MTEEQFKNRCAEIIRDNVTFSGQLNDYVIHGALDAIWKLHTEQKLVIPAIMQAEGSDGCEHHFVYARDIKLKDGFVCTECGDYKAASEGADVGSSADGTVAAGGQDEVDISWLTPDVKKKLTRIINFDERKSSEGQP